LYVYSTVLKKLDTTQLNNEFLILLIALAQPLPPQAGKNSSFFILFSDFENKKVSWLVISEEIEVQPSVL